MTGLRFHWSLSQVGDPMRRGGLQAGMRGTAPLDAQAAFCLEAERLGIDSVLMAIGNTRPDPLVLSAALGSRTRQINFMVAVRPGLVSPTLFVQQINTLASLTGGRVHVNVVVGHTPAELLSYGDALPHDQRYARCEEFIHLCRLLWDSSGPVSFSGSYYSVRDARLNARFSATGGRGRPQIYVGGSSHAARDVALSQADCLWRFPDRPDALRDTGAALQAAGKELGLLVSLIARDTRAEAVEAAQALVAAAGPDAREAQRAFERRTDSKGFSEVIQRGRADAWITDTLWAGAVPVLGAPAIALVGSGEQIIDAILEYKMAGVSQYLLMGWPDQEQLRYFGERILPELRQRGLLAEDAAA